jgi:hypothetical protein
VVLLALVLFPVLLLWRLPATWLDHALRDASGGGVGLVATRGSLWRGEGRLQAILPNGEVANLGDLTWRFEPAELARGGARFVFARRVDGRPVLDATLGATGWWRLRAFDLSVPASLLGRLSTLLGRLDLAGDISARLDDFSWRDGRIAGAGAIDWRGAASGLSRVRPLGEYHVDLAGKGERLEYRLASRGGALALSGYGSWRPGAPPDFRGEAIPAPANRDDLTPLLRMIGKDNGAGGYTLALDANTGLSAR